jgi:23S rRNA pseudouridine2605 synthase
LQKLISAAGITSRRAAEDLIRNGRVAVNGHVVRTVGAKADPEVDKILVDGVRLRIPTTHVVVALHKPRGIVSTLRDPEGRPSLKSLLPRGGMRLYPVGRLDLQSTGLLLLTNDGELAEALLHPRTAVERVYAVKVHGAVTAETRARLRRGVRLDDGIAAAEVRVTEALKTKTWLEVIVREGRWRLVRRLFAAVGHPVDKLARVKLGPIELGRLGLGSWRSLPPEEVAALRRTAGLTAGGAAAPARSAPRSRAKTRTPRARPRRPAAPRS